MPLLLLLPVQKSDDLGPHERNKHPVEEPRTKQPQHRPEQPQGQHELTTLRSTPGYSHNPLGEKKSQGNCDSGNLFSDPSSLTHSHTQEMLSKTARVDRFSHPRHLPIVLL